MREIVPVFTDGNKEVSVAPKLFRFSSWHEVCFVTLDDDSTCVSALLLLTVTKFLTKSNLRKLGFILTHSSSIHSTMMRLSWRQELEATVNMVGNRNSRLGSRVAWRLVFSYSLPFVHSGTRTMAMKI